MQQAVSGVLFVGFIHYKVLTVATLVYDMVQASAF